MSGSKRQVRCIVCDSILRPAPTRRWWMHKNSREGVCYECILSLAQGVLRFMEHAHAERKGEK